MINKNELQIGDIVGHPSWGNLTYECVIIQEDRFSLQFSNGPLSFPYYSEFFIKEKRNRIKIKSGFGKWISSAEERHVATKLRDSHG